MHTRLRTVRPLVVLGLGAALLATAPAQAEAAGGRRVRVKTSDQLVAALATARAGDVITLANGTYTTRRGFTAAPDGRSRRPITLKGTRRAIVSGGGLSGHYGLSVTGNYWHIVGLTVTNADKGIVMDGSVGTVIDSVSVHDVGAEGIHFRSSSANGVVRRSTVSRTGRVKPQFGEGIYVGSAKSNWRKKHNGVRFGEADGRGPDRSDKVLIERNVITDIPAEGIDVKEGTTGGVIRGNTFRNAGYSGKNSADSWIDIKGNGWTVSGNTGSGTLADAIQVHAVLAGWGLGNVFSANTVTGGVPGFVVGVYPADDPLATVVHCDNTGAALGASNIACTS